MILKKKKKERERDFLTPDFFIRAFCRWWEWNNGKCWIYYAEITASVTDILLCVTLDWCKQHVVAGWGRASFIYSSGLQLKIIFMNRLGVRSKYPKMAKNVNRCFLKPNMTPVIVLFCPPPRDIQLTVAQEWRNQSVFALKKLELHNFWIKKILKLINRLSK